MRNLIDDAVDHYRICGCIPHVVKCICTSLQQPSHNHLQKLVNGPVLELDFSNTSGGYTWIYIAKHTAVNSRRQPELSLARRNCKLSTVKGLV